MSREANWAGLGHVFGPVPSRRLGRSLGLDPIPFKTCTYDCVYCQLGRTTHQTLARAPYVPASTLIAELQAWLASGRTADVITLSGSGEPTLNSEIGAIIQWLKQHVSLPVALLTNGALLFQAEVREAIQLVDLLLPSLDAGTPAAFARINRPCPELSLDLLEEGLLAARRECPAAMWLEVMLVAGFNDSAEEMEAIRKIIEGVQPDRVQINTVVRPPAEAYAAAVSQETLAAAREVFGERAEIIAPTRASLAVTEPDRQLAERMLSLLARRPCTLSDLAAPLAIHPNEAAQHLARLLAEGIIRPLPRDDQVYYVLRSLRASESNESAKQSVDLPPE
jgi:wyosine [tRNA(Phe)-imidazoG37] synthetase (radical SAM superfamily)